MGVIGQLTQRQFLNDVKRSYVDMLTHAEARHSSKTMIFHKGSRRCRKFRRRLEPNGATRVMALVSDEDHETACN